MQVGNECVYLLLNGTDEVVVELVADGSRVLVVEDGRSVVHARVLQNGITTRVHTHKGGHIVDLTLNDQPEILAIVVLGHLIVCILLWGAIVKEHGLDKIELIL